MTSIASSSSTFATTCLLLCGVLLMATPGEAQTKNVYQPVWDELVELIALREYGTATSRLETLAQDRQLKSEAEQFQADQKVLAGLISLERIVREQAAAIPAGKIFEFSRQRFTVIRYEKSPTGDALILKPSDSSEEKRKLISELPATTWVELAQPRLESLDHPELILGVFLGFDRFTDRKSARRLFNEAAGKGDDVDRWLTRLAAAEAPKVEPGSDRDKATEPTVVSTWAHEVRKNGKVIKRQTYRLYSNGRINHPAAHATWVVRGNILVLTWPDSKAPGGQWKDVLSLSRDGQAYVGKNQDGFTLLGKMLSQGELKVE